MLSAFSSSFILILPWKQQAPTTTFVSERLLLLMCILFVVSARHATTPRCARSGRPLVFGRAPRLLRSGSAAAGSRSGMATPPKWRRAQYAALGTISSPTSATSAVKVGRRAFVVDFFRAVVPRRSF